MRLSDLLRPHLDGVHTVVETGAGEIDLAAYLHLPEHVVHVRRDVGELGGRAEPAHAGGRSTGHAAADAGLGAGTLALVLGPGTAAEGARAPGRIVERMRPGARGIVLFGQPPTEMPYHRVLDDLVAGDCQVLQAASLEYAHLRSGIAFAVVDEVQPPRDYFGRATIDAPAAGRRTLLRAVNEYVLADLVTRETRARLADLERAPPRGGGGDAEEAGSEQRLAETSRESARLREALADREAEVRRLDGRLAALEGSVKMRVGQAFADAARRPRRGAVTLPRQLYRLWRRREPATVRSGPGRGSAAARPPGEASAVVPGSAGGASAEERRLLKYTAVALGARERPVIAGILREETCAALRPDAVVNPVLPHDALLVLERTDPDVVLVETAAAGGGPWAYLGNLVAVDRDARLAELISAAHALGRPVVLCRNAPAHLAPGLARFGGPAGAASGPRPPSPSDLSFDAVFDGDLGVQLAHTNPIDLDPGRPRRPVAVGPRDPRAPAATRRLVDGVLAAEIGLHVAEPSDWRQRAAVHRGNAVFLAASPRQVVEQLAAGGRVVAPSGEIPDDDLRGHVVAAADAEHAGTELRAAAAAGPRDPYEVRTALRTIFRRHAVPARLGALARGLGLSADPLAGRRVAVLVDLDDADAAGRVADAVLRQRHRPAEVVVHARGDIGGALDELPAAGIGVRSVPGAAPRDLAAAADSPLVMPWSAARAYPETYLLDLVCAQECSRADAVGHADGDGGSDYVFVPALVPALIRRDLLLADPVDDAASVRQARSWARRGARLFAIAP